MQLHLNITPQYIHETNPTQRTDAIQRQFRLHNLGSGWGAQLVLSKGHNRYYGPLCGPRV